MSLTEDRPESADTPSGASSNAKERSAPWDWIYTDTFGKGKLERSHYRESTFGIDGLMAPEVAIVKSANRFILREQNIREQFWVRTAD